MILTRVLQSNSYTKSNEEHIIMLHQETTETSQPWPIHSQLATPPNHGLFTVNPSKKHASFSFASKASDIQNIIIRKLHIQLLRLKESIQSLQSSQCLIHS